MRPRSFTILVAEDDPNDQQLMLLAFRQAGMSQHFQFLHTGEDIIRYLKGQEPYSNRSQFPYPSFLFLDLKMPRGDGFSVLEYLRHNPEFAIVPTIVFSASADPGDVRKAYQLGAHAFLMKPIQLTTLTRQLKLLHDFWMECEVPQVDAAGRMVTTTGSGGIGARFGPAGARRPHPGGH